jgi:hypothetical protein
VISIRRLSLRAIAVFYLYPRSYSLQIPVSPHLHRQQDALQHAVVPRLIPRTLTLRKNSLSIKHATATRQIVVCIYHSPIQQRWMVRSLTEMARCITPRANRWPVPCPTSQPENILRAKTAPLARQHQWGSRASSGEATEPAEPTAPPASTIHDFGHGQSFVRSARPNLHRPSIEV